jgi:hypothetical protein
VKRSFKIVAVAVGFVAVIGVILPPWPQNVTSREPMKSDNATYRFTLYCSRIYSNDLQDVSAEQLDSISKAISDIGPSGVEIKACEWTVFNCVSNPNEEFRAVIRNLVGTALLVKSGARTNAGRQDEGASDPAPEIRRSSRDEPRVVAPSRARTAVGSR